MAINDLFNTNVTREEVQSGARINSAASVRAKAQELATQMEQEQAKAQQISTATQSNLDEKKLNIALGLEEKPSVISNMAKRFTGAVAEGTDALLHPLDTAEQLYDRVRYGKAKTEADAITKKYTDFVNTTGQSNKTTTLMQMQDALNANKKYNDPVVDYWYNEGAKDAKEAAENSFLSEERRANIQSNREDSELLGKTGQFFAGLAESAGFMVPSIITGNVAGALTGSSAVINAAALGTMWQEVYNRDLTSLTEQGYDWVDASDKAFLDATIETATEMLGSGVPGVKGSKGVIDPVLEATVGRVASKVNKSIGTKIATKLGEEAIEKGVADASKGVIISGLTGQIAKGLMSSTGEFITGMLGEGAEEVISAYLEPYVDRMTINPEAENATVGELGLSFLSGAVMGGFFNAFTLASNQAQSQGKTVLYQNGKVTVKDSNAVTEADVAQQNEEIRKVEAELDSIFTGVENNEFTNKAAKAAEDLGLNPSSVNDMTMTEMERLVRNYDAKNSETSAIYQGEVPEGMEATSNRVFKNYKLEDLQIDDPDLATKMSNRSTYLFAIKSILTGLTEDQAKAFGRSGIGNIGALNMRFFDFRLPTNIDRMTSADIQQWYTDNVVPAFMKQAQFEQRRNSKGLMNEELRVKYAKGTSDTVFANRDEFANWVYSNVPVAEQTTEMLNKAYDEYDRLISEQRTKQDNFLGNVTEQFARFGLHAEWMSDEEMASELGSQNAFFDPETNTVKFNRASITTAEAARVVVAHEIVHAIENMRNARSSEIPRLRGMIDTAMHDLGMTRSEWLAELEPVYRPLYKDMAVKMGEAGATFEEINDKIDALLNEEVDAYFLQLVMLNPQALLTVADKDTALINALEAFVSTIATSDMKSVLTAYEQDLADKLKDIQKIAEKTAKARDKMLEQNAEDEKTVKFNKTLNKEAAKAYSKLRYRATKDKVEYPVNGVSELKGAKKYYADNVSTPEIWVHTGNKGISEVTSQWLFDNGYSFDRNIGMYAKPYTVEDWNILGGNMTAEALKAANDEKRNLNDSFKEAMKGESIDLAESNANMNVDINDIFNEPEEVAVVKVTNPEIKDSDKIKVYYKGVDGAELFGANLYSDFLEDIADGNEDGIVKIVNARTNKTLFDAKKPSKTISADGVSKVDFTKANSTNFEVQSVIDQAVEEYKSSKATQIVRATNLANKVMQFNLSKDMRDKIIESISPKSKQELNKLRNALSPSTVQSVMEPRYMANLVGTRDSSDNMYSKIEPAISNMSDKAWNAAKGDLNSFKRYLTKSANGISEEEIKYSGIIPYIEANPKVSKQEALAFLFKTPYQLEEIKDANPAYSHYATTNGENYQEYLYVALKRLSSGVPVDSDIETNPNIYESYHYKLGTGQNLVVHTRESDYDYKGDRVKFIEEIQSDLHNDANRVGGRGYASEVGLSKQELESAKKLCKNITAKYNNFMREDAKVTEVRRNRNAYPEGYLKQLMDSTVSRYYEPILELESELGDLIKLDAGSRLELAHFDSLIKAIRSGENPEKELNWFAEKNESGKIPDEPYKSTYTDYALKRIIDRAVREDYDRVAWTSSQMQVDRWDERYRKGYEIEYDQGIPNFLKKYLAQWGIELDSIELDTGEVPAYSESDPIYLAQLESDFREKGPGLYADFGAYLGSNIKECVETFLMPSDIDRVAADVKSSAFVDANGLTTYVIEDSVIAEIRNSEDLAAFKRGYFQPSIYSGAPNLNAVKSFKINDAMRKDILTKGQPRFMASMSDIRRAAAEDYYDTISLSGDPFEITDDEIYRNFNRLDDELERQWEKAQEDYTTYRYGTPKKSTKGQTVSQSADNMMSGVTSEQLSDEMRKNILNGLYSLTRMPNLKTEAEAKSYWNKKVWYNEKGEFNISKALEDWSARAENGSVGTPEAVAQGFILWAKIKDYAATNTLTDSELKMVDRLTTDVAMVSTNIARSLQIFKSLNKMTGDGRVYYVERMLNELKAEINQANNFLSKGAKNVLDDYTIPEDLSKLLRTPMNNELISSAKISETLRNQLTNAQTIQERLSLIEDAIKDDVASNIPPTVESRITAWRMLSMLGNVRTHLRNIVSNAAMYITRNIRDVETGVIEDVFLKDGNHARNTSFTNKASTALKQLSLSQYQIHANEIQAGGKLSFKADVFQRANSYGNTTAGKFLEKLGRWNSDLLESEDAWFLRANFRQAFASYAQANAKRWGVTADGIVDFLTADTMQSREALNECLDHATTEAKRATYREASTLASWLNAQEKKGTLSAILIEGVLPFKRTPINILKQGARYSPIGIMNAVRELTLGIKSGEIGSEYIEYNEDGTIKATHGKTVADAISDLCAGMTGTMIMGLGLFLGGCGAMKAGGSDNDKEEQYDEMLGNQKYSLTIGDTNITLDWLTPISMPLFAGVSLAEALGGQDATEEDDIDFLTNFNYVLAALGDMADPFTNLSLLSGVNEALNSYSDDKLGALASSAAGNYVSQFIPTLAGQIARTMDGTRRTTYAPKDSETLGGQTGARFLNKLKAKIPFLASTNAEYVDQWGRTEEYSSELPVLGDLGGVGRAINQMATPWYSKTVNNTEVDDRLAGIFEASKDSTVLPSTPQSYYTIDGEKYYLDANEYTDVKKTVGQLSYAGVDSFFKSTWLNNLTVDEQADAIGNIYSYAKAVAKNDFATQSSIEGYEAESIISKVDAAQKAGLSIGDYFVLKKLLSDDVAGTKNADKKKVARSLGLSSTQTDLFLKH